MTVPIIDLDATPAPDGDSRPLHLHANVEEHEFDLLVDHLVRVVSIRTLGLTKNLADVPAQSQAKFRIMANLAVNLCTPGVLEKAEHDTIVDLELEDSEVLTHFAKNVMSSVLSKLMGSAR